MLLSKISYKKLRALLIVISSSAAAAVDETTQHGQTLLTKVVLSDDKELKEFDDGVFIHSLSKPEKHIHLTFNR